MGLIETMMSIWLALGPGGGAMLKEPVFPTGSALVSLVKATGERRVGFGGSDGATTKRPWGPKGAPDWCNIHISEDLPNSSNAGRLPGNPDHVLAFALAHEMGHCADPTGGAANAMADIDREAFADAFASCALMRSGRGSHVVELAMSRRAMFEGRRGRSQALALTWAKAHEKCEVGGSAREDYEASLAVALEIQARLGLNRLSQ